MPSSWFDSPTQWYVIGFLGQILFSSRFFVQWIVSEFAKKVIFPRAFWYLSLAGGAALFAYALHRRDPVFAIGQGAGILVYIRNLMLEHRLAAPQAAGAASSKS
jgi:lipid-A-disaccharide synthase-like uncharacterized protein